jgi:phenylacetate-CoA ligase
MTPEVLDRYLDLVERLRPVQIFSHPSALDELARRADERGRRLDGLGTRVVFLTAEELYRHQRERIERVFGCRAANGYGGRDSGFIAQECPEGGMHLNVEDIVVEIVGDDGERLPTGRAGEIVVTHLRSEEYPFVRYRTGDVGIIGDAPCACGRGLPILREVHGRADDLLLGLDGARVPGQVVVLLFRDIPGIAAFKVIQEEKDRVRIQLVKTGGFPANAETAIADGFRVRLGAAMRIEIEVVDSIPREASGKYRTVVSRVGPSPTREAEG